MDRIRVWLQLAGKREQKVAAVFSVSGERCDRAVRHLRAGAPGVPVWLFCTEEPPPQTAGLCDRVIVESDSMALLLTAEKELWPHWVALGVATWTGGHGQWPVKLAPFLIPPSRALLMNRHGDFFAGKTQPILRHVLRNMRDQAHSGWRRLQDILCGVWLWLFGRLAQRFSFLSRYAFHRWSGTASVAVPLETKSGLSIACFRYGHRYWNSQELETLVRTSDHRWVLFLEDGANARIDDLLPLFADPRTFAVSRQIGFRDWKPCLFPMAPFRQLQPREATQTLAPVSNAILVDREKLAALRIPRTIVPGTAWLLIFWKAAAAGLRSYSVGGTATLQELPDWPYEEAEFVVRVLSDPGLRAIGPQEPDRARGSIAMLSRYRPASRERLTILVVSPYLPYPLSHGGAVRIYNLCRVLSGRVDFLLACFREQADMVDYEELHEVFREVYVVDRDEKAIRNPALPRQVREYSSRSMRALIAELGPRADLLQVEYTHLAAFRDAAPGIPAILVEHDLTFTLYQQFSGREATRPARREYERWLAFESRWLRTFEAVWTMSEQDRAGAVKAGSPPDGTFVVPNGVDLERFAPGGVSAEAPEILYVGSFRHRPNVLGFELLRREVMPRVWSRFSGVKLRVVAGPQPQTYWQGSLDSRISLHGLVEDLRPFYARATVVAAPLVVSAGTSIKVLEAMACGKAVVTTPVGCAGLDLVDGYDALIRAEPAEVAAAISELLANGTRRAQIGRQARCTVEQRFGWRAIASRAYESYLRLSGVPAR